jgi:PadR family transcriptional regulator PadR
VSSDPWPGEWLRGVLDVCVLAVLAEGTTYGYAISARLDELGLGAVKGGTLYPLLTRLEQAGLVTTQWRPGVSGPGRKYFALTAEGRADLAQRGAAWRQFAGLTSAIVDAPSSAPTRRTAP